MKRILVVEDDPNINRALGIRLKAAGFEVLSAEDGYMGLSAAIQQQPDLMVLDLSMPAGGGFSIVERLAENPDAPDVPFIVLTASKRPEYKQRAEELGAVAYFEKPYRAEELVDAIEGALGSESQRATA